MELTKEFRLDINGLRAVAVLMVLIFHIEPDFLNAGFLGVDIFLVISGYLITKSIFFDLSKKQFTLKRFYTKRIQRLFPALAFTIVITLIAGYFLLSSQFYERLSKSSLSALFSVSNFFFWSEDNYFNIGSDLKPLLHTWSLGLEEQFYLLWPILLIFIYKLRGNLIYISLFILGLISLVGAQFLTPSFPTETFFLLPFRIFEFVLGALCLKFENNKIQQKIVVEFVFVLAMALMIVPAIYFDKYTHMPSVLSLIPCLGAMLIICSPSQYLSKWLIENPIMAVVGKASYSIYLFHWPLIVYYKYWKFNDINTTDQVILFFASIVGGLLMWFLVESAFKGSSFTPKKVWISFLTILSISGIMAAVVYVNQGFPSRDKNPYTMAPEEIIKQRNRYWSKSGEKRFPAIDHAKRNVIIMGNSHGIDLVYALVNNGIQSNIVFLPTTDKCSTFGATANQPIAGEIAHCEKIRKANMKRDDWQHADAIYLHDNWLAFDPGGLQALLNEIRTKTDAPIYIFGPKMIYIRFPLDIIKSSKTIIPNEINAFAEKYTHPKLEAANTKIKNLFDSNKETYNEKNIHYIDVLEIQKAYQLVSTKTSKLLYFDGGHLSEDGATELGEKLKAKYPYLFD